MEADIAQIAQLTWKVLKAPLFTLQGTQITLISLSLVVLCTTLALILSPRAEGWVRNSATTRLQLDSGVAYAAGRFTRYAILAVGVLFGFQFIGFQLGSLAVFAGFISIGLGFGLQNIMNNFVSGLILMLEQPIKPGDRVKVGDYVGQVQSIRLRSTTIHTNDNLAIIVPNSNFISQAVINWSFGDLRMRVHVPVGMAYGTDPERAIAMLLRAAIHPDVLLDPAPAVILKDFGADSLNFELLAWITDPPREMMIRSALNLAICRECEADGLEIAFPQRDLHLRDAVPLRVEIITPRMKVTTASSPDANLDAVDSY